MSAISLFLFSCESDSIESETILDNGATHRVLSYPIQRFLAVENSTSFDLGMELIAIGAEGNIVVNPDITLKGQLKLPPNTIQFLYDFENAFIPQLAIDKWDVYNLGIVFAGYDGAGANTLWGQYIDSTNPSLGYYANWLALKGGFAGEYDFGDGQGDVRLSEMQLDIPLAALNGNSSGEVVYDLSNYGYVDGGGGDFYLHIYYANSCDSTLERTKVVFTSVINNIP